MNSRGFIVYQLTVLKKGKKMKKGKENTVTEIFRRFSERTEDVRSGKPVHIPYTRLQGYTLLDAIMDVLACDKEQAIKLVNEFLYVRPAKGGVVVFEAPPPKAEKPSRSRPKDLLGL